METVSVETISETGVSNLELSDKQKRSGKKKKKSRKKKNELKSNDSQINNQNGKEDEGASFEEKKEGETEKTTSEDQVQLPENSLSSLPIESCQRASVSPEEPGVTLLHINPILSTKEYSLPDANTDGSNRKRSRRKKKKKEDALCEEKTLDDAEKTTNEDQVLPPKNPLSNNTVQEDLCQQAQDSYEKPEAAQLLIDPILSTRESDAINTTGSERKRKRKERKKDKDRNALRESGVDTNSEVTTKCNAKHDSEAEASKLISIEEKNVATVVKNSCLKSKDDTVEQGKGAEVNADATVSQTQSPKAKKRKKRKIKTMEEVCNPLRNTLATSTISRSVECMGTVEQGKGAEVKADDTVSQTQSPKTKKKKRRKTKTMEVCNPLGNTLATSTKSSTVECMENNDEIAGQELMSNLESKRENSATVGKSGFQNLGKGKEKITDEKSEVNEDVLGAGVCEVRSKKRKGKKRKASSADHETANMEVYDPSGNTLPATIESGSVECLLDHSNREVLESFSGNAGQESVVEDMTSKTEKSATSERSGIQNPVKPKEKTKNENVESNQDALGTESVADVGSKRKKRKRNKMKNCESVATMDNESVQCSLSHSNRDGIADGETAGKDLARKIEDSETEGKHVQNVENTEKKEEDQKGEVDQDALGAEGIDKVEVKTKKRKSKKKKKSCEEEKTDNMDEKNDVSIPIKEEEPEIGGEKVETSLSSSVLIHDNVAVAQGVASPDLPRCSCEGQSTKKLVVFDLNGILADIVQGYTGQFVPDGKVSYRSVFKRPFVDGFLEFCFQRYDVGIWSSRRIGLDYMTNIVMGNYARNLLFCFDQNICTTTSFNTQEKSTKPLFLKDLKRVWNRFGTCLTCGKRKYNETNTLLVDDSPQKALSNPPHTGIFPFPYQYRDSTDSALGPDGELRKYLERLADAENVQKFVEENPIGQTAITETHESWEFYSKVVEAYK